MTIETKFNIGEEVWVKDLKSISQGVIMGILIRDDGATFYEVHYGCVTSPVIDNNVFSTKEELLKSL